MGHLPQELVSNVLSRLTTKDLMKCKCVCKCWFDLITDHQFIENYYLFYNNQKVQQQEHLLLIPKSNYSNISIVSWNPNEPEETVSNQHLKPPYCEDGSWDGIIGPCNGIYLLLGDPCVIMNPSLRQFITLPPYHITTPGGAFFSLYVYIRFGFDPKTNDYKVVVLKDIWREERLKGIWIAELYSLNSNSWRNLDDHSIQYPFETSDSSQFWTYVNNCCHWLGYTYDLGKSENDVVEDVVLSFDMVNELFRKIKMPKITHSSSQCTKYLIPFCEYGTIGVLDCPVNPSTDDWFCFYSCFDVWILKDYWDEGSWLKRYNVGPLLVNHKLLVGYYGSNQFLWKDTSQGRLVLYGLDCKEHTKDLWIYEGHESITVVRYMESLVSLQKGNNSSNQ